MKRHIYASLIACLPFCSWGQNQLVITNSARVVMEDGQMVLFNTNMDNSGTFQASNDALVVVMGTATKVNSGVGGSGTTQFQDLQIDKSSNDAQLNGAISVTRDMTMTTGNFDLNNYDLTLGTALGMISGESETSRIYGPNGGEIVKTQTLNAPSNVNPGNMGLRLNSPSNMGSTTIRRGHVPQSLIGKDGIERYFNIVPTTPAASVDLTFFYFDAELNGLTEGDLTVWQDPTLADWFRQTPTGHDPAGDFMFHTGNTNARGDITLGLDALYVQPKIFLQGPYNAGSGLMRSTISESLLLPQSEPYTALGYAGLQNVGVLLPFLPVGGGATPAANDIVDWVLVELRSSADPSTVIASRAAFLRSDGDVIDTDFLNPAAVPFVKIASGNYYVAVRHRNHLGVMSRAAVNFPD